MRPIFIELYLKETEIMAKIIKEKDFDGRCMECGCYFEYTHEDLEPVYKHADMENSVKYCDHHYVKCPKCGAPVVNIWHNGSVKK